MRVRKRFTFYDEDLAMVNKNDVGKEVYWKRRHNYTELIDKVLLMAIVGEYAMIRVIDGKNRHEPKVCKMENLYRE